MLKSSAMVVFVALIAVVAILQLRPDASVQAATGVALTPESWESAQQIRFQAPNRLIERDETEITWQIPVQNLSASGIEVSKPTSSCGCTRAEFDRLDILAGQSALLTIDVSVGQSISTQFVSFDAHMLGNVVSCSVELSSRPRMIIPSQVSLGTQSLQQPVDRNFTLLFAGTTSGAVPNVLQARCSLPTLVPRVGQGEIQRLSDGTYQRAVSLSLAGILSTIGSHQASLELEIADPLGIEQRPIVIPLLWSVPSRFRVRPERLTIVVKELETGTAPLVTRTLSICSGNERVGVVEVKCSNSAVVVQRAENGELSVSVDTSKFSRPSYEKLVIATGDASEPVVTVPLCVIPIRKSPNATEKDHEVKESH